MTVPEHAQKILEAAIGAQAAQMAFLQAEIAALRQQLAATQKPTLVPAPVSTTQASAVND